MFSGFVKLDEYYLCEHNSVGIDIKHGILHL